MKNYEKQQLTHINMHINMMSDLKESQKKPNRKKAYYMHITMLAVLWLALNLSSLSNRENRKQKSYIKSYKRERNIYSYLNIEGEKK